MVFWLRSVYFSRQSPEKQQQQQQKFYKDCYQAQGYSNAEAHNFTSQNFREVES